jgi:endonuclease-8
MFKSMEGPSLTILKEELQLFQGQKVLKVSGNTKQPKELLKGRTLEKIDTWGKVLFLTFTSKKKSEKPILTKTHFLMFGSYRINDPKENRQPRLELKFKNGILYFYACSILFEANEYFKAIDREVDVMSEKWNEKHVISLMGKKQNTYLCDLFLDQKIFAGSGNIVKNEVLFNLRKHPLTKLSKIPKKDWPKIAEAVHEYCWNFYEWKKRFELRRHWQVYRQHKCPLCKTKLIKETDGKFHRKSFFCPRHQPVLSTKVKNLRVHEVLPMKNPRAKEARFDH